MAEHDVKALDSKIHHVETGSGAPIVILHGNPTSPHLWRDVTRRLEGEGRCLAPDLVGRGKSGKPKVEYRFADHARYLDGCFEAPKLDRVTLVLHDWGGALAGHWAKRNRGGKIATISGEVDHKGQPRTLRIPRHCYGEDKPRVKLDCGRTSLILDPPQHLGLQRSDRRAHVEL